MVAFGKIDPMESIKKSLLEAYKLRSTILDFAHTNAYRLVNGEADGLPGLIIDMYADVAVLQVSTLGMEQLKPFILGILAEFVAPKSVYEKSDMPSRREEGLEPFSGLIQ
jgi:23S rRNA (cytosine1962-C5)-methyltransferase